MPEPFCEQLTVNGSMCQEILAALEIRCQGRHRNGWQERLSDQSVLIVDKGDIADSYTLTFKGADGRAEHTHGRAVEAERRIAFCRAADNGI